MVIGGLEKFINNFAGKQNERGEAERATRVAQALQGYSAATLEARNEMLERALARNGGNRTKAAAELGISRRTLQNRLKERDAWS